MVIKIGFDSFAERSFKKPYFDGNTERSQSEREQPELCIRVSPQKFMEYVNLHLPNLPLRDGYAPFCKHLFIPNPFNVLPSSVEITENISRLIKSGYQSRRPEELPILSRWISLDDAKDLKIPPAKYIDCILYSREQVVKEAAAMAQAGGVEAELVDDVDYLVISLKFQNEDNETPMLPITMMRNALISEGGSGVPIDRQKYKESVDYWSTHIELKEDTE